MKKILLTKTDRLVIEAMIRHEHRNKMLEWHRWRNTVDLDTRKRRLMLEHYDGELQRLEHVANSMGFGPL